MGKRQKQELKKKQEMKEAKEREKRKVQEELNRMNAEFKKLQEENSNIQKDLHDIQRQYENFMKELDELEEDDVDVGDINFQEDDNAQESKFQGTNKNMQEGLSMQKQLIQFQQLQKQVQHQIDRMALQEIDNICTKVISSHIDRLHEGNMDYIVVHSQKRAIFKLKSKYDTFGEVKEIISDYFGLPKDAIFLENSNKEILLKKQYVIDELFPMQSSKLKGDSPTIYVTFKKNMRTLDYILGDPKEKEAQIRADEDKIKDKKLKEERKRKADQATEKALTIDKMRKDQENKVYKTSMIFGLTSTVMFLAFCTQHIMLASTQYQCDQMNYFNEAVTKQLFPQIDVTDPLAPKQFLSVKELEDYFLNEVDYYFQDQSEQVDHKAYFHQFNHIVPFVKLVSVRGELKECGNPVSNWIDKNKAVRQDEQLTVKQLESMGYPFQDERCYTTWTSGGLDKQPLKDTDGTTEKYINFTNPFSTQSIGRGMLNTYDGQGFTKIVKLDMKNNKHYFYEMFKNEIINQGWTRDQSQLAFIMTFYVYNSNLWLLQEKRIVIEWLDSGGFINMEHDQVIINIRLYRNLMLNINSCIIILNGIVQIALSIYDILVNELEDVELEDEEAAGGAQEQGEENQKVTEDGNQEGQQESKKKDNKSGIISIIVNCSGFQKINFTSITLTFIGQALKYVYDVQAQSTLNSLLATHKAEEPNYIDISGTFVFNQICMGLDSIIICLASVSLLKYTSLFEPQLEKIIITFTEFLRGTFRKTMTMILLTYTLYGLLCHYILSYYQYGFFRIPYALLRSCIVFLSGFVINEQKILLSFESVENLMRYTGFAISFSTMIVLNILIKQVMLNIIAIYMHNDYHSATLLAKRNQDERRTILKEKISNQVKLEYKKMQEALVS